MKLSTSKSNMDNNVISKATSHAREENNYFRISVKPQLTSKITATKQAFPIASTNTDGVEKIEVKLRNPILSYEPVESPPSGAPFAQKVADLISKKQEPVDDVYGLEQSAISNLSSAQHTFSLAHHKQHPKLHEKGSIMPTMSVLSSNSPEML